MKKRLRMKAILCLCAMFVVLFCPFTVSANETEPENQVHFFATAAKNGYYSYDARTGEETYVPVSEYEPTQNDYNEERMIPAKPADPEVLDNELTEYYENDSVLDNFPTPGVTSMQEIEPFAVSDPDGRRPIYSTAYDRYSSTCLVVARYNDGAKVYGTGFLVSDYHVLTAGHLAYSPEHDGYAHHFAVYAGSNNGTYKLYSLAYEWDTGQDYVNNCDTKWEYFNRGMYDDWAILECEEYMGGVGHMAVSPANDAFDVFGYTYYLQGYPKDLNEDEFGGYDPDTTELVRWRMYLSSGEFTNTTQGPLPRYLDVAIMDIDTDEGQSGAPVYRQIGSDYCAQAIFVDEDDESKDNYALLITDWLYNVIEGLQ